MTVADQITHEDLQRARDEFGVNSGEYLALLRQVQVQKQGYVGPPVRRRPKPRQEVSLVLTDRELRLEIEEAIRKGDNGRLRELSRIAIARQLVSKDSKLVRDAAKAILNDIKEATDEDVTVVEYLTPAAPGWSDFPPADYWLPDNDAVEVTTPTD